MLTFRLTKFNLWDAPEALACNVGVYKGGKTSTTSSGVSIPPDILARYDAVNSQAQTVAQTPFQQYSSDPNAFVAPMTATQQAGVLGTNQYSSEAQPFYQGASNMTQQAGGYTQTGLNTLGAAMGQTENAVNPATTNTALSGLSGAAGMNAGALNPQGYISQFMSPYISQVVNPTSQLLQQQFNQAQAGQLGNAINNGAFGGDREAVTAANLQQQQGLAYGQTIGGLYNQAYGQALGAAQTQQGQNLQQAGQAGALASQYGQLGQGQQNINLAQANQYGNQGLGFGQLAGQYGSLGAQMGALGTGAQTAGLSGAEAQLAAGQSQQQTEQAGLSALYNQFLQQQSYPFQTTQYLANIAEGTGSLSGSNTTTTSPQSYFSDERLKEDIADIGQTYDGQKIIKYKYKGDPHTRIGLSAQDVESHHPEAVGLAGGYRTVDYDAATQDAERNHRALGGFARAGFANGGLSPNSGFDGGFYIDPSYLQAQQEAYSTAPWATAGMVASGSPYGGKSHVPPSSGGAHASLATAKPPSQSNKTGLQQTTESLDQLEKLAGAGNSAFNWAKGLAGSGTASGSSGSSHQTPSPTSNDASAGQMASASGLAPDMSALSDADFSGLDDITGLAAARGGMMRHGLASGGYTDAALDDESSGGAMPYASGTGERGYDIPDDRNNYQLASSNSSSSGSGGSNSALGLVKDSFDILSMFGLKQGGRVGLAGGGDPPEPDAPTVPPADYSTVPGDLVRPTVHPTVEVPTRTPGLKGAENADQGWMGENQQTWVPIVRGLGKALAATVNSPSRYAGAAIAGGIGAGMDEYGHAYEDVQNGLFNRGQEGANTVRTLTGAQQEQAETGNIQAGTGYKQAATRGQTLQNEQMNQALRNGDIFTDGAGNTVVRMSDGTNMLWGDWASKGFPPTAHQVHTAPGTAVPGKTNGPVTQAPAPNYAYLGSVGKDTVANDLATLRIDHTSPVAQGRLQQSQSTDNLLQGRYDAAARTGSTLNQMASQISSLPTSGMLAGGPLMDLKKTLVSRYNDVVNSAGHPEQMIDPTDIATAISADKLHALMSFGSTHGFDQNSLGALMEANGANPSASLPREAAMKVLSGLYVDKQRDIDAYNYLQEYKHELGRVSPGTPNWYYAQNAMNAFNRDHNATQYGAEKEKIEQFLNLPPSAKGNTVFNAYYHRNLTPAQRASIEQRYGSGVLDRYFGNQ